MTDKVDVLDHGYVRLVDHMGNDLSVVNAARVSFDKRSDWQRVQWDAWDFAPQYVHDATCHSGDWCEGKVLAEKDVKLIRFLAKNGHWSPFAHPQLQFEVKCPMLVKNQWIKHRIGMTYLTDEDAEAWDNEGWNEQSMRYVEPSDFYTGIRWRSAPDNKKQGSKDGFGLLAAESADESLENFVETGLFKYRRHLERGGAPEQARVFLPMYAMYTTFYWTTSLYGVARFLQLRLKEDAQYEIREYARAVQELAQPLFPVSFDALSEGA